MRPQTGLNEIPLGADFRGVEQRLEPFLDLMNEPRCSGGVIFGDECPDIGEVVFGLFGYVEGERSSNFLCPLRMIFSASKAPTRPSAIS